MGERMLKMEEKNFPHTLTLENKNTLRITRVEEVDTFDEEKIILYTTDDTLIIEGYNLHIQKLDIAGGELLVDGEILSMAYTEGNNYKKGKGFFKHMLK